MIALSEAMKAQQAFAGGRRGTGAGDVFPAGGVSLG